MGNALGNFQDYWNEIYSSPRMLGGFIWEWSDQGLHKHLPDGRTVIAMGGDFGDVPNHSGFCIKGLVSADREVFPKYWEVKKVYQPVAIEPVNLKPGHVAVKLINRNSFLNLDQYQTRWTVTDSDGQELQSGILPPINDEPGQQVAVKVPVAKLQPAANSEYWLRISLRTTNDTLWAKAGYEVAWQQMQLAVKAAGQLKPNESTSTLKIVTNADQTTINANSFGVTFARSTGTLISLNFSGHEFLAQSSTNPPGPILQLYRAPTDNDKGFGHWLARDWQDAGLNHLIRHVDTFTVTQPHPDEVQVRTVATSSALNGGYTVETTWTIHSDGTIDMDNDFHPFGELPVTLPRIGIVMQLAPQFENLRWCGRGPWENYPDRKQSADMGVWSSTVTDQYVPYVRPQETGAKQDVRWLTLTNAEGHGLRVETESDSISFSALHFTAADLSSVRHNYELTPRPEVILSLDFLQCGLGNSSCGPGVLTHSAVPTQDYSLKLRFAPVSNNHQ